MCDQCLKNFQSADEEVRSGVADRVRGLGSAMTQAAIDGGYDPLEVFAALEASSRYFRKQFDQGLQAVADDIAGRVAAAVEASAAGGKLEPKAHSPLRFQEELPVTPNLTGAVARGGRGRPDPHRAPRRLPRGRGFKN